MSVNRYLIILYGIKGDYADYNTEDDILGCTDENPKYILPNDCDVNIHRPEEIDSKKLCLLSDGMSGEYAYVGFLLSVSDTGSWYDEDVDFSIDAKCLSELSKEFIAEAKKYNIAEEDINSAKLHIFYHFT